jgi:wingless-type MMTV integration site family protein 6
MRCLFSSSQAVKQNMRTVCKCHGMSGSCTLKTCWRKLPVFRDVGLRLKEKFDGAAKVIPGNDGRGFIPENEVIKPPGKEDLVYVEESPNHCVYDRKTGSLGTRGRECNATSPGVDGCELLCCGRGYETIRVVERVNCKCRFQWCCQVICGTCTHKRSIHRCL